MALYFGFEESSQQIVRNMQSIGVDLRPWVDRGLLHFHTVRPSSLGLEAHLASIHQLIRRVKPSVVVIDPLSNFLAVSDNKGVRSMLTRLVDFLKAEKITAMFTHLTTTGGHMESTDQNVSSIMDAWLLLRDVEHEGRRSYALYILKCRGMAHSHEMREFVLSDNGIRLGDIYTKTLASGNKLKKRSAAPERAASGAKG